MISDLKPYPAMMDSGVEWLGEVPEHWGVRRSKRVFAPRKGLARPGDVQLSATQAYGVIPQEEYERRVGRKVVRILQHLDKRRHVEIGDFVISMRSFQGGLERAWATGCIRSSYVVLGPVVRVDVGFFAYLFKSRGYIGALQSTADFIRDGQDLNFANFCAVDLPFPPLPEQAAIARYLDHVDRRVRRLVQAKRKLIALLAEQKQAIIHRAVTRGLDTDVSLKDSGVGWLGKVPEHWTVLPLKRAFESMDYGISDSGSDDGTIPVLTMGHIRDGSVTVPRFGGVNSVDASLLLKDKDLLFNRTNSAELVAKVGLFRSEKGPVTFASYLVRMRSSQQNHPEFLNYLLNDKGFLVSARREAIPSLHQSNLNPTRYGRLRIALPPTQEQRVIVESIVEQTLSTTLSGLRRRPGEDVQHELSRSRVVGDVEHREEFGDDAS